MKYTVTDVPGIPKKDLPVEIEIPTPIYDKMWEKHPHGPYYAESVYIEKQISKMFKKSIKHGSIKYEVIPFSGDITEAEWDKQLKENSKIIKNLFTLAKPFIDELEKL
jgi:hypothetical protein